MQNDSSDNATDRKAWLPPSILAISGTLLLAIIGSGLWELAVRPGLFLMNHVVRHLFASLYVRFVDIAYDSAALGPDPLPNLILLLLVTSIPVTGAIVIAARKWWKPYSQRKTQQKIAALIKGDKSADDQKAIIFQWLRRRLHMIELVLICYLLFLFAAGYSAFTIINEAIYIRRVHEANIAILTPYIPSSDLNFIQSRFASMRSKADYDKVYSTMYQIARAHGVALRTESMP